MGFDVAAEAYDRFMGRYSVHLAPKLIDFAGVRRGHRVLDVGCGPGALIAALQPVVGAQAIVAVEPSQQFAAAAKARHAGVQVESAPAEHLPFEDRSFDVALAQLVVHFMSDPVAGLREMARVTIDGGTVAACVWDHGGGRGPLSVFWQAVREDDPDATDESNLAGSREGHLTELFTQAGVRQVVETDLTVAIEHPSFDEWWEPFTFGVGPAGSYVATLDPDRREQLRARCRAMLPPEPFVLAVSAWTAKGVVDAGAHCG